MKRLGLIAGVVIITAILHEAGHFLVGVFLGNAMQMDLNSAKPIAGSFVAPWHAPLVTLGGPLVSLLQAGVALFLVMRNKVAGAYLFLITPFIMRLVPYLGAIAAPASVAWQDEGKLSLHFGLGVWALPITYNLLLLVMVWLATRTLGLGWKRVASTVGGIMVSFVLTLLANDFVFRSGTFL